MTTAERTSVLKVGENRGRPRIWVEGRYLEQLGFTAGTPIEVAYTAGKIEVRVAAEGDRKVSVRRDRCIVDMNSAEITEAIGAAARVEVRCRFGVLEIVPAEVETARLARPADKTVGSLFSGGGLLDEAAKQAGFTSAFGVELDAGYADLWQRNHGGHMFCGSIDELPLLRLPKVELLVAGIPCEPFSTKRRNAGNVKAAGGPENHPLADLNIWALMAVKASNPRTVVVEEAPAFLTDPIGVVFQAALRRLGYTVEGRVVDGTELGGWQTRKRAVIVGRTAGGPIPWPTSTPIGRTLADVLHHPDDPRCEWFTAESKPWLFDHWAKQTAKGNWFASAVVSPSATKVAAISKRYFNGQGDGQVVQHPTDPTRYRWLSLVEVKRLFGVPDDYDLGPAKTVAGEMLGQGVQVGVFRRIIEAVAE